MCSPTASCPSGAPTPGRAGAQQPWRPVSRARLSCGGIDRLLAVMRRLRDRRAAARGTSSRLSPSIAPYTIEEAYEVADAIAREDWAALPGELGDLLLQVVYYTQMAAEAGRFDFDTVAQRDRRQDGGAGIRTCSATSRSAAAPS